MKLLPMLDLYVYSIKIEGNDMAALSMLPPDVVNTKGLPAQAVLGEVDPRQPDMTVDGFTPNDAFLELLSQVIIEHAPQLETVQKQAENVQNGPIYVVDHRNVNRGDKPPFEDVIGWFGVRDGEILTDSWNLSPNYKLLSNDGPIELEMVLEEKLMEAIWAVVENSAESSFW